MCDHIPLEPRLQLREKHLSFADKEILRHCPLRANFVHNTRSACAGSQKRAIAQEVHAKVLLGLVQIQMLGYGPDDRPNTRQNLQS